MAKSKRSPDAPFWFDGRNINEALFCDDFLSRHKLVYTDGAFFTPDGRVTDELPLRGEIFEELRCCAVSNIPRKISNILELMKLAARVEDLPPEQDRIHVANGTLFLGGTFTEGKARIVRSRLPVAYNPNAPKPDKWLSFLSELLYPEDIPTLQEFIGYCLIPSNKGQRMMVIKGSGGEGKSQIGAVLSALFGCNMKDGSIGKISENRFARADLEHVLLCIDDDMISVLSAVAEIERENIRVQTMEGRIQKAREGKWNGGFAPYGYQLVDGKLVVNEEEAEAIRVIYDQYIHTDIGANGIAKYLENHGIRKIPRQNGKNTMFDAHLIRLILKNPVYCGKIAYGRRRTEKVRGTRNEYKLVEQDNYLLVDGLHEAIVSEEVWQAAQVKLLAQAKKYEHVNRGKDEHTHLLSGIVKCPICGAGMYGNKSIKHKSDGTKYKDFYYYGCKHRSMIRGHKCDYKKQIREELLDSAVAEVIVKLVSNPKFAAMMQEKINMKVDTAAIDQEIANYEKQLRQHYSTKTKLAEEIDSLDPDDRHYVRRKADLDDRLYKMYDKIEDTESQLIAARAKKQAIEAEKLTGDNIYKVLIYFEKLYGVMTEAERRQLIEALILEIQIYPERQPNGQWLKSIKFKLPIIEENMELSLDTNEHIETVALLIKELE